MPTDLRLAELSFASTDLDNVTLQDGGGALVLGFEFPGPPGARELGFWFDGVRAYRHRAESHCTDRDLDAYDVLVEVPQSEWVAELLAATPPDMRDLFPMHHYLIYLDSAGCYEVVAASWALLPGAAEGASPGAPAAGRERSR